MPRDTVVVVVALLEDEFAHIHTVDADYGLDAIVLEEVTGDVVADTELLACFRLDVDYLGLEVSIFMVIQFINGAIVHKDRRFEVGKERVWGHDEEVRDDRY